MRSVIDNVTIVKMGTNKYFVHLVKSVQGLRKILEYTDMLFSFVDYFIDMTYK